MSEPLDTGVRTFANAPIPWRGLKAETRLWASLVRVLSRRTRWFWFAVVLNVVGQLGVLFAAGKWPLRPPPANTMRGVDFYPWKDFIRAIIYGAQRFKVENGYLPRLVSPSSFNEHVFARKFFAPLPLPSLADKLAAREYVKACLGVEFLPVVAWIGDSVEELFAAKLPAGRYLLKANHGSGWNLLLNLPDDLCAKRTEIEQQAKSWLASRFGYDWGEWQYCIFKPKLFLEEFIDFNGIEMPDDYKFFCFHGKVRLIEIDVGRPRNVRAAFYTPDWKYIPVTYVLYGNERIERARPPNLDDMIRVAEAIAGKMEFARIDLYSDRNTKIRFGEITFAPGDAGLGFSDSKLDYWLGAQFGGGQGKYMLWDL